MASAAWHRMRRSFVVGLVVVAGGCIQSTDAQWIPTHMRGDLQGITANAFGVLGIGSDGALYRYPGPSSTWERWGGARLRLLAGGERTLVTMDDAGTFVLWRGPNDFTPLGTLNASVVSFDVADDSGDLVVVINQALYRARPGGEPRARLCPAARPEAVAVAQSGVYISDGNALFIDDGRGCRATAAPAGLVRLTAQGDRVVGLDRAGDVHALRAGAWRRLPRPITARVGRPRLVLPAVQVAVSALSTWIVDGAGTVFALSEANP